MELWQMVNLYVKHGESKQIYSFGLFWGFYVALTIFQSWIFNLEAGDNQSLKSKWREPGLNPEPLAPQGNSFTTLQLLLPPNR